MRLFVDLDTLAVTEAGRGSSVDARRGDRFPVEVRFRRGGIVEELSAAAVGRLVVKRNGDYSGLPLAQAASWRRIGRSTASYYLFDLDLQAPEIDDLFEAPGGSLAQLALTIEIEWSQHRARRTTRPLPLTLFNDYAKPV